VDADLLPGYPVQLLVAGRCCVVVGAGAVGRRKIDGLLAAGARVRVVDPRAAELSLPDGVEICNRLFAAPDLDGAFLAFAATGSAAVNAAVAEAARLRGIPLNRADQPGGGDFSLPAVLRLGRLSVAVATDGASPAAARLLRDQIAAELDPAWTVFVEIAAALRRWQLTKSVAGTYNQQVLHSLLEQGVLRLIAAGDIAGIDRLLSAASGDGCTLAGLGLGHEKGLP